MLETTPTYVAQITNHQQVRDDVTRSIENGHDETISLDDVPAGSYTVGHKPSNPGVDSETRWNPE